MAVEAFHPAVAAWFESAFEQATPPQRDAWPRLSQGEHALIAAPTGSGKTLAAFLACLDQLVREDLATGLPDETRVLYVSPLKALSHDIELNLDRPLGGIAKAAAERGEGPLSIRTWLRTSDTPASSRARAAKKPPHIVVTTPESLYLLLTSQSGRRMLSTVRTVIVDEIHALLRDKRGSHLGLSLERLEALVERAGGAPPQRIGLSATQKPIAEVARFLTGERDVPCAIIDGGHRRELDLELRLPGSALDAVMAAEVWDELYAQLAVLAEAHRTTLIFVNTRRGAERLARQLSERLGEERVAAHHGSLARELRLDAERRLRAGELSVMVATASLELGIDIGDVDLVCQLGSPRSIATFLQRVGRSGHALGRTPKGRLFPLSRDDLVECVATLDAVRRGELDKLVIPEAPLDVLAQQIVAETADEDWEAEALFDVLRRARAYRSLTRESFDSVVRMLADGFSTRRGRRAALVHFDGVGGRIRGRRGARLAALTSGGAIPDSFDYQVKLEPEGLQVGTLHEDFAIESMAGDIFQLGNTSYRILRVEPGVVRVADAKGQPPSLPFWIAEAPTRTWELSQAVGELRARVEGWLDATDGPGSAADLAAAELDVPGPVAQQLMDYLAVARAGLGALPTPRRLVLERFFDETGSMHVVLHSTFGARINRGLGLALRKRFCRSFNVELQAAATDDAIILSLGPMHSFALEDVYKLVRSHNVEDILVQALLAAPMFSVRWRWNASRSLAVLRFRGGKKVPPQFQRMLADDLLAVSFPDQVACQENIGGDLEVPDHPLVKQTVHDCLTEAMDIGGIRGLLARMESGEVECISRDLAEPSALAAEILNARPYAFLDDAPLEERRTQAVQARRWLDPNTADDLGALDVAAIDHVITECFPDPRDADELHDALVVHACLSAAEVERAQGTPFVDALVSAGRMALLRAGGAELWVPAERVTLFQCLYGEAALQPQLRPPPGHGTPPAHREQAALEVVRGRLELVGPTTVVQLAAQLGLPEQDVLAAVVALETEGFVLRGRFDTRIEGEQWCERRLLARIHRRTLERLRKEIEPVTRAVFMRFLFDWQHVSPQHRSAGPEGLMGAIESLQGFEAQAASWERDLLPARVAEYDPAWLDSLCWSGRVAWGRNRRSVSDRKGERRAASPIRTTPITLAPRAALPHWLHAAGAEPGEPEQDGVGADAQAVLAVLQGGAHFFGDLVQHTGVLASQVERGLAELVARGLVTADGFGGLRALVTPADLKNRSRTSRGRRGGPTGRARVAGGAGVAGIAGTADRGRPAMQPPGTVDARLESAGRWGLLSLPEEADLEVVARGLLRRWGVVFRRLLDREGHPRPWRDLVRVYRRLEARGELRGGRFVEGFAGEQFALPEAVSALRKRRRQGLDGSVLALSAADPLNLTGIVLPQDRVATIASHRLLFRDGLVLAAAEAGKVRFFEEVDASQRWELERQLTQRRVDRRVRAYLGSAG